jgi:hypothetical protein
MLPPDTWRYEPGKINVVVSDPVATQGMDLSNLPELMGRTRRAILSGFPLEADALLHEPAEDAATAENGRKADRSSGAA